MPPYFTFSDGNWVSLRVIGRLGPSTLRGSLVSKVSLATEVSVGFQLVHHLRWGVCKPDSGQKKYPGRCPGYLALKVSQGGIAVAGARDYGVCAWAIWARVDEMGEAQGLVHMPRR
jgi:hypothetical protein